MGFSKAAKAVLVSSYLSVCPSASPSVRVEQLGIRWEDFHEIKYLSIFRMSVEKIQTLLKS